MHDHSGLRKSECAKGSLGEERIKCSVMLPKTCKMLARKSQVSLSRSEFVNLGIECGPLSLDDSFAQKRFLGFG
jgi:hypothetical protein